MKKHNNNKHKQKKMKSIEKAAVSEVISFLRGYDDVTAAVVSVKKNGVIVTYNLGNLNDRSQIYKMISMTQLPGPGGWIQATEEEGGEE